MLNTINLNKYGEDHPILFYTDQYSENNNLYVGMVTMEDGYPEPWGDLTVNLDMKCDKNCAFIDTNNNGPEIIKWLLANKIATPTGVRRSSGYCLYTEVEFNMENLRKHSYEGWA